MSPDLCGTYLSDWSQMVAEPFIAANTADSRRAAERLPLAVILTEEVSGNYLRLL
jgi:hypothetical protein